MGDDLTARMWKMAAGHAKLCDPGEKVYAYSGANSTIYVDSVFGRLLKIEIHGVECRLDGLLAVEPDKAHVLEMVSPISSACLT